MEPAFAAAAFTASGSFGPQLLFFTIGFSTIVRKLQNESG
jgi:hypothetical protein